MKVFGKWLVICSFKGHSRIASSFMAKQEAIEALDKCFTRISDNQWIDSCERVFHIEKNTKEYK